MRKINRKRIAILICIIILIIIEIIAFGFSRAKNIKEIELNIADYEKTIDNEKIKVSAIDEEKSGYYINLPETVNEKTVLKYYIKEKKIEENEKTTENNIKNEDTYKVEKIPNEKIYLTKQEIENKKVTVQVKYDKKQDKISLYNKKIQTEVNENIVTVKGYMPLDAITQIKEINEEDIENILDKQLTEKNKFKIAYDIKIISNGKEYEPKDFGETIQVSVTKKENEKKLYKIFHIDNENKVEEVNKVDTNDITQIKFEANSFSTYAIYSEEDNITEQSQDTAQQDMSTAEQQAVTLAESTNEQTSTNVRILTANVWDGKIANSYAYGNGRKEKPYLIATGAQLAYLAQEVTSGNTYEGQYFQLVNDINLNNITWKPIGNNDSSFRGVFDGAGCTIQNTTIETDSTTPSSKKAYGFFGSIGGGSSYSEIKNLQFSNVNVNIAESGNASNSSGGLNVGIVAGKMYKDSKLKNVIAKNGTIANKNTIQLRTSGFQAFIGGLVGFATNTTSSENDPGEGNRYEISNCFSDIDINTKFTLRNSNINYAGQYAVGGVIGAVRSQPVWPTNCLYTGTINADNAFVGPIIAYLRSGTSYSSSNNYNNLWYGNDAGSLQMTSYYTNYKVNNTDFAVTMESGDVPNTTTYRIGTGSSSWFGGTTIEIDMFQGVNKGIYTDDLSSRLQSFNSYIKTPEYVTWKYENGTYSLNRAIEATIDNTKEPTYMAKINNNININPSYTYVWTVNGKENTNLNTQYVTQEPSIETAYEYYVYIFDGVRYASAGFYIEQLEVHIEFTKDEKTGTIIANLAGNGLKYVSLSDYSYKWYTISISGKEIEEISGQNTNTINNAQNGIEYKVIATNNKKEAMSAEGQTIYGNRNVIYVNYSSGNDSRDGFTEDTSVKTMAKAYGKLDTNGTRDTNIIVIMRDYSNNDYIYQMSSSNQNNYSKKATITGCYAGKDQSARLYFEGNPDNNNGRGGRFLYADTTLQYLTLYANKNTNGTGVTNLYCQGNSLTIGEQVKQERYATTSNTNALVDGAKAPNFHILGGFANLDSKTLYANNGTIIIKSGCFARVIAGSRNTIVNYTSNNTTGTAENPFNMKIIIDIKDSTKGSYQYDVNLLVCGQTDGNIYGNAEFTLKNGDVGRIAGGSIGYSRTIPSNPGNSYFGSTTLNIQGGTIYEMFGGSLGRLQSDVYYYGKININISGGTINNNLYGVGAGGVTGYNENSTDPYKNIGKNYNTDVAINISGGTINGNIYGAGYGYSSYLTADQIATDGGTLYSDSHINISGGIINGDIYGGGRGYSKYSGKTKLAQVVGNTYIVITQKPEINGEIYGAGEGISGYVDTAKLIGTSNISIDTDLDIKVYGAGNISQVDGKTNININSGTHTADIYGGGNLGKLNGESNVFVNGGTTENVYGGGQSTDVTTTNVYLKGGETTNIYGGSNTSGTINQSKIELNTGIAKTVYGGNNAGGITTNTYINLNGCTIPTIYGGGNQAESGTTVIDCNNGTVTDMYGGGNLAKAEISKITIQGGNIENIYGGGNKGELKTSNITINAGTITNIYGGGNEAGLDTSNINLVGGIVENTYGGANSSGTVNTTNVKTTAETKEQVTMDVKYSATETTWETSEYPTAVTVDITYKNNSDEDIENWNSYIKVRDSVLNTNYSQSNITQNNETYTINQDNRYYGINKLPSKGTYSIEFTLFTSILPEELELYYGFSGTGNNGISFNDTNQKTYQNIYGGNNKGGTTNNPNVVISGGNIANVYGGGNKVDVEKTNVLIENGKVENVFGGGNAAGVNTNTILKISGGEISTNVYGGGNEGTVKGNTNVTITNSKILGSAYAGGNGVTAIVNGDTNINIDGDTIIGSVTSKTPQSGCVFGGGNAAATGTQEKNISTGTVNIVGGTIYGNVYGGANTSVIYGKTNVKIGYNTVNNTDLKQSNLYIKGTVFGGGEANASGSENYDYYFISVTQGIEINIDGTGYKIFKTEGSIFGSGNASSTSGESYINIKNFGTLDEPQKNISLQRATTVTLDNSSIILSGATDRTNEYSSTLFTISRVNELKLKNNSSLYLNCGSNLLQKISSLVDDENENEQKATVTIDKETGENTKNVDNRIYMLEGKNLNIATNEQVTAYGEVYGMMFFGMFTSKISPNTSTGMYNHYFENNQEITNLGTFSSNSYILARHNTDHNTSEDGFYSNYNNDGHIKTQYIGVTPEDDLYYIWLVGEDMDVTSFDISLTASKYATLGTYELLLKGFSTANTKFSISGFSSGLSEGITLVNQKEIDAIQSEENLADSVFGLNMKTGKNGWQTNSTTNFYTANGGTYEGTTDYDCDNSNYTPTLTFCFYHAQNLTLQQELGTVKIRFEVLTPIDDLNYGVSYVDINIALSTALYQDNYYEAAISPGEEFNLFTATETDITDSSIFSTYYSLYIDEFSKNKYFSNYNNYERVLVSRTSSDKPYPFKANTKITMLDMVTNEYYYYVVTNEDEKNGKYKYNTSEFIKMGSSNEYFDDQKSYESYYDQNQDLLYENYIFHADFSEANVTETALNNTLLMELQDDGGQTLIGVLGIERDATKYSIYKDKKSKIDVTAEVSKKNIYLKDSFNLIVTTNYEQQVVNSKTVYDTSFLNNQMGIKITIYDKNGNQLNSDSLLGITYTLNNKKYYPRIDGSTRINIAERVSNVLSKIKIETANNSVLNTGEYKIRIETFGSPDGIYYGLESSDYVEVPITIINGTYGLNVSTDDNSKFIDKKTGNTLNGNNSLVTNIKYSSALATPKITVSLYRRDYTSTYSKEYIQEDLANYVTNKLTPTKNTNEYLESDKPIAESTLFLYMKENIKTGTYKLVYKLYDDEEYIGDAYEYFIVK